MRDGKTLHVLEVSKNTFVAYDAETGLSLMTEMGEMPDGSKIPRLHFGTTGEINGVLFPYLVKTPVSPQVFTLTW